MVLLHGMHDVSAHACMAPNAFFLLYCPAGEASMLVP
jgi:hypothetical protein